MRHSPAPVADNVIPVTGAGNLDSGRVITVVGLFHLSHCPGNALNACLPRMERKRIRHLDVR